MNEETELETRSFTLNDVECRSEDGKMNVKGYAIRFGEPSVLLGGSFKEIIDNRSLDNVDMSNVYLLNNHNTGDILGSTKGGTMNLTVTDRGLHFSADLPDTNLGRDTFELVKRGDLSNCSFGFTVDKDTWDVTQSPEVRTVTSIGQLKELTLTAFPAYETSSVSVRSLDTLNRCQDCRSEMNSQTAIQDENRELANKIYESIKQ